MTTTSKISAVLPININEKEKSNSCELLNILFSSLEKFSPPKLFDKFFLVCPKSQIKTLSKYIDNWPDLPLKLLDEEDLVPEFKRFPTVGGWRKQQVIKLAIASFIKTPYYLTFDADIVCTSPISEDILLPNNKALLQKQQRYTRTKWWTSSAKYLNTNANIDTLGMDVTPAILSTKICLDLIQTLNKNKLGWIHSLLSPHKKYAWQRILPWYKKRFSWTEYSLYYLFLEKNNNIEKYHSICGSNGISQRLFSNQNCVWNETSFDDWNPSIAFSEDDHGLFCVIQSNKNITPHIVWQRIEKYIT